MLLTEFFQNLFKISWVFLYNTPEKLYLTYIRHLILVKEQNIKTKIKLNSSFKNKMYHFLALCYVLMHIIYNIVFGVQSDSISGNALALNLANSSLISGTPYGSRLCQDLSMCPKPGINSDKS